MAVELSGVERPNGIVSEVAKLHMPTSIARKVGLCIYIYIYVCVYVYVFFKGSKEGPIAVPVGD